MAQGTDPRALRRYGRAAQAFHWATAAIVLAAFLYGPGGAEERVYSPARDFDRSLHETLRLTVFFLVIARLHTWLGDALMRLAGLHALAALYHHFVLKDAVLLSMLPRR